MRVPSFMLNVAPGCTSTVRLSAEGDVSIWIVMSDVVSVAPAGTRIMFEVSVAACADSLCLWSGSLQIITLASGKVATGSDQVSDPSIVTVSQM